MNSLSNNSNHIKQHRNMLLLMILSPLVLFSMVIGVLFINNSSGIKSEQSFAAVQPNAAYYLGSGKVGYDANVPGLHFPANLTNHNGNFTSSSDNQVIQNVNVSGRIIVEHKNVKIINVKAKQISVDAKNITATGSPDPSANISWSTIGVPTGLRIAQDGYAAVGNGNITIHRSEIFGAVDLLQLSCGKSTITENWFRDMLLEPVDPGQNNGASHSDPIQFIMSGYCKNNGREVHDTVIYGNRFESWTFRPGQNAGDTRGNMNSDPATSGIVLVFSTGMQSVAPAPRNTTVSGNYVDGNYHNGWYGIIREGYEIKNLVFSDNQFKKRYANYGRVRYASVTPPPTGQQIEIYHGRNTDIDTGATIKTHCDSTCVRPLTTPTPTPTPPTPTPPSPTPTPTPPTPTPTPPSPTPSPVTPPPPPPPVTIPDANPDKPVAIPDDLPKQSDGSVIGDFDGDGLNEVAKDTNNDNKIDPKTEIVQTTKDNPNLTDTTKAPITPSEYKALAQTSTQTPVNTSISSIDTVPTDTSTVAINAGPIQDVAIPKPVAYTFLAAGTISLIGVTSYLAITKLTLFATLRGKWGL